MDITVQELKERLDKGEEVEMIDVREPHEWEIQHLEGVKKISLSQIPQSLQDLDELKEAELVLICRSGARSGRATKYLQQMGFSKARNLEGGMKAWKQFIDPSFEVA